MRIYRVQRRAMRRVIVLAFVVALGLVAASPASASLPIGNTGCTLHAYDLVKQQNPNTWAAYGSVNCANDAHEQLEICMQQLVTGGWSVIQWSCIGPADGNECSSCVSISSPSHWVGLTSGRWYRTWSWGYVNGQTGVYYGNSHQG